MKYQVGLGPEFWKPGILVLETWNSASHFQVFKYRFWKKPGFSSVLLSSISLYISISWFADPVLYSFSEITEKSDPISGFQIQVQTWNSAFQIQVQTWNSGFEIQVFKSRFRPGIQLLKSRFRPGIQLFKSRFISIPGLKQTWNWEAEFQVYFKKSKVWWPVPS